MSVSQPVHGPPSVPAKPAMQTQIVAPELLTELDGQLEHELSDAAPVAEEYVLAAQAVHAAEPISFLYLPGRHAKHVPPSEPVYPDTHLQSPMASLPELLTESTSQLRQVPTAVAPTVPEYVVLSHLLLWNFFPQNFLTLYFYQTYKNVFIKINMRSLDNQQ